MTALAELADCPNLVRETPGQTPRRGTVMATDWGQVIATDWNEYDYLLARFDAGCGPEPECPVVTEPPVAQSTVQRDGATRKRLMTSVLMRFLAGDRSVEHFAGCSWFCSSSKDVDPAVGNVVKLLRAGRMPAMQPEIDRLLERMTGNGEVSIGGMSDRTLRRRAQEREELARALARDGRRTDDSIRDAVAGRMSSLGLRVLTCEFCSREFEAKRADARFCPEHRKPDQRTKPTRRKRTVRS